MPCDLAGGARMTVVFLVRVRNQWGFCRVMNCNNSQRAALTAPYRLRNNPRRQNL
jgi:hypothetical protein